MKQIEGADRGWIPCFGTREWFCASVLVQILFVLVLVPSDTLNTGHASSASCLIKTAIHTPHLLIVFRSHTYSTGSPSLSFMHKYL